MWPSRIQLIEPSLKHATSLVTMVSEYRRMGERRYHDVPDLRDSQVPGYVAYLTLRAQTFDPKPSITRQHTYWLVRGDMIVGATRLRPHLTPEMHQWGGHISYDIRPSERRKGYGTRALALTLAKAQQMKLSRVRLTCYQDNIASAKIIERNGGELVFDGYSALAGGAIFAYEIEL